MLSIENVVELARARYISYGRMVYALKRMSPGQIAAIEMDFAARDKKDRRKPPKGAGTPEPKRKSGRWKRRKIEKYDQNGRVLAVYDGALAAAAATDLELASVYAICRGFQKDVRGAATRGFSLRWQGSKTSRLL